MPVFNITDKKWNQAKQYLSQQGGFVNGQNVFDYYPEKTTPPSKYYFKKINRTIYAFEESSRNEPVKIGITQAGLLVHVEVEIMSFQNNPEALRIKMKDQLDSGYKETATTLQRSEQSDNKYTDHFPGNAETARKETYYVYAYRGDRSLAHELSGNGVVITLVEKLELALKAIQSIQALHQQGILHGSISSHSFMVNGSGNARTVKPVGFKNSKEVGVNSPGLQLDVEMLQKMLKENFDIRFSDLQDGTQNPLTLDKMIEIVAEQKKRLVDKDRKAKNYKLDITGEATRLYLEEIHKFIVSCNPPIPEPTLCTLLSPPQTPSFIHSLKLI